MTSFDGDSTRKKCRLKTPSAKILSCAGVTERLMGRNRFFFNIVTYDPSKWCRHANEYNTPYQWIGPFDIGEKSMCDGKLVEQSPGEE